MAEVCTASEWKIAEENCEGKERTEASGWKFIAAQKEESNSRQQKEQE